LISAIRPSEIARIAGIGVAMPGELHEWAAELGLPPGALDNWREVDVAREIEEALGLPVTLYNDASAACAAELAAGSSITCNSALYLFLGAFIGGGLVIGGQLYRGDHLNAAAIGSMPMAAPGADGRPLQLIHLASVIQLERLLDAAGLDGRAVISGQKDAGDAAEAVFRGWAKTAAEALARAIVAAASVIDIQAAVVDGLLKPHWRDSLLVELKTAMKRFNQAGLSPIDIAAGTIGARATVLGAALLPLHTRFSPDTELLARSGSVSRYPAETA
jgi:predicted NBD/HSP70 family sugar kinase